MMHPSRSVRKPGPPGRTRWGGRPRIRSVALFSLLLSGCPTRFDPRADPIEVRAADPTVDHAYAEARARYDRGELEAARAAFRSLREQHPSDPAARAASLWEARSDLALGEPHAAVPLVEPLTTAAAADPVAQRARFLLGLALVSSGEAARGRALLLPFAQLGVAGDDGVELHAALAEAAARLGDVEAALAEYQQFYEAARPVERAFVRAQARAIAASLTESQAQSIRSTAAVDSLARATLSLYAAARATSPAEAERVLGQSEAARSRYGLVDERQRAAPEGSSATRAIGVVLPLSGKNRVLGERALRGVLLSSGTVPPSTSAADLRVRDSGSRPDLATAAVEDLAREGAIAIVGSPDRAEATAAAARSAALGLTFIDLSSDESHHAPSDPVFKMLRPNGARAVALAAQALKMRARRFAVLRPDTVYGKKMGEAFAEAVRAHGGEVVVDLHFDERATTFISPARQLAALHLDAVFVPAAVGQLELIAAQLAATGVTRAANGGHGAVATLYATADGLVPAKFLANGGRYAQGAVLAPAFLADQRSALHADRFRAAYGDEPSTVDALGYDAIYALRDALARAAEGDVDVRRALPALLSAGHESGFTGGFGFGAGGERLGSPQLYVVDGDQIRALP